MCKIFKTYVWVNYIENLFPQPAHRNETVSDGFTIISGNIWKL